MPLSRLDNFIKNVRGNILYVNPNDLDATDSIENQGNSLTRPFKTIQRALIEAARFSWQSGLDNDRFGKTTILVYPGEHIIDNRPGWIPDGTSGGVTNFRLRNGTTSTSFSQFDLTTNFDLSTEDNALYKMNSVHGGVILPRGTSIVGMDLRKTTIRPRYVPNPENDNIERSAIFRLTGSCYLWQFTIFDGSPNSFIYKDYTNNTFIPNFSHHKLTCFEYADGINGVSIDDEFQTYSTDRTDLDMYYEKVGLAYGPSSGREIQPDYPSAAIDIQSKVDEYRIVGATGGTVGISSIRAGNGVTPTTTITVTTAEELAGLDVDTPIRIEGVPTTGATSYNGQFVVSNRLSDTQFQYEVSNPPTVALPATAGALVNIVVDTVSSASPYVFNISLRSVYGMCGLHADGNKATGFKSMVVAQFTGIGLQKDRNAFVKYNSTSGVYEGAEVPANANINTDSTALYKPSYENYHIKCSNSSILQLVSIFAIGFANHFVADSGGDQSVTNSNSNFGAKSLVASGYRTDSFPRDDVGYITHIIPPREIESEEITIEFTAIDVGVTTSVSAGAATTSKLYLYDETNPDVVPESVLDGYRIGAKVGDTLNVLISQSGITTEYSARIVMPHNGVGITTFSSEKSLVVSNSANNTLEFSQNHSFLSGETVRVISNTGQLPDGLENNRIYYAITGGVGIGSTQIKLAQTLNDATSTTPTSLTFNTAGGTLTVISRVSDKQSGEIGHPIQFDSTQGQWYINVSSASTENSLYTQVLSLGEVTLGEATSRTYIKRKPDNRSLSDTVYKLRYCIPAGSGITTARPPIDGFVIQESTNSGGYTDAENAAYFSPSGATLSNESELRNPRFIANATWSSQVVTVTTELPHNLRVNDVVKIENITPTGYNGSYTVTSVTGTKEFTYTLENNPGTFTNDVTTRDSNLPRFARKKYNGTYYIYRSQEIQRYIPGKQDGVYHLFILNSSNKPNVSPFSDLKFSQPIQYFYPQTNRDNPVSDPKPSVSFARPNPIGQVVVDDPQHSVTKETLNANLLDAQVGVGITNIISLTGVAHTIHTTFGHGLNRLIEVGIANSGAAYGDGTAQTLYNARLVGIGTSVTGSDATARITVNASGNITSIKIMDGGSAYGIGNTLSVVGVATTAGHTAATVSVTKIYDNVGDTLIVDGIRSQTYDGYNGIYRITGVPIGSPKAVTVESVNTIGSATTLGIGSVVTSRAVSYLSGRSLSVYAFSYNNTTGLGIVTTTDYHGLKVDNKVRLSGATESFYNDDFVIKRVGSSTSFTLNVGINTFAPAISGTLYIHRPGYSSSGGNVDISNDSTSGRLVSRYAGITTTLASPISDTTTETISIENVQNFDLNLGDYLTIDDELVRIKTTPTGSNPITVFRGVLGTRASTHLSNTVVRRVSCDPIEFRRNSIIRASGHTFEYVGFGPGNYSTALPDRQDRQITPQEELIAQSTKIDGGINVFTGMNNDGDFYVGNKKVNSATGQEEVFDSPIPTVTGEDLGSTGLNVGFDLLTPLEVSISRSIRVEGGSTKNIVSEFNGPVVFNNKITSNSTKGLEANSLFLQGDAKVSRKYTVGSIQPTSSGNPGDVVYNSTPVKGGSIGWVYTTDNDWFKFGSISLSNSSNVLVVDQLGVSTSTPGDCKLRVGSGTSLFCVDVNGVGIGTSANQFKLNVIGSANVSGGATITGNLSVGSTVSAAYLVGDGSGITNLNVASSGWSQVASGLGTGIYDSQLTRVGIGTTRPRFVLEVGSVGTGLTDLYVNNRSIFDGPINANSSLVVSGIFTSTSFRLDSSTSNIRAGIVTATTSVVNSSFTVGTAFTVTSSGNIGFGVLSPTEQIDINRRVKFKSYYEGVSALSVASLNVNVDLTTAQTFTLIPTSNITRFTLQNPPTGSNSTSFTIAITQGSTPFTVAIDTFYNSSGSLIPVYWASGVVPTVTNVAGARDVYSFTTFDGGSTLYGVVGGQNFS